MEQLSRVHLKKPFSNPASPFPFFLTISLSLDFYFTFPLYYFTSLLFYIHFSLLTISLLFSDYYTFTILLFNLPLLTISLFPVDYFTISLSLFQTLFSFSCQPLGWLVGVGGWDLLFYINFFLLTILLSLFFYSTFTFPGTVFFLIFSPLLSSKKI